MKKIIFLACAITLLLTSCDDYLDVKPYGKVIPKTPEEFSALIHTHLNNIDVGEQAYIIYDAQRVINFDMAGCNDFEACLTEQPGRALPYYMGNLSGGYGALYEVIRDCNIVINNMTDEGTKTTNNVLAAAYALRAVCYYQLLRLYCEAPVKGSYDSQPGMPLVDRFDMEARPIRSSMQATINFIETDLQKSLSYKCSDELYRFTENVTKGYLARLYFWTEQWDKCLPVAQELLKSHPLLSGDAYKEMIAKPYTPMNNHLIMVYRLASHSAEDDYNATNSSIKFRPVSKRFIDCFQNGEDTTDVRYAVSINRKRQAIKPIYCGMRAAEFKFMEAESFYHLGKQDEALQSLNELRAHRIDGVKPYTRETLPAVPQATLLTTDCDGKPMTALLATILNERHKEFFLEGDRFFELKRNGGPEYWVPYNGRKYTNLHYMYTLPIPEIDIRITEGMVQNPGYTELNY
ncbi:RagB/SusD family nutrient uptake outer membrane protein [Hallella bergensis]|uniref:RagB/SusD family nutrient uptake outer membrane protein n=1 Tax=Hallella bergensis TaxID=242750 RepID=UPI003990DB90